MTIVKDFTTNVMTHQVIASLDPARVSELSAIADELPLGLSSAGMLRWGALGNTDPATYDGYRPSDEGDLERCETAFARSPQWLAARIEPLLAEFRDEVAANVARWATARGQRATAVATSIAAAREHFESLTGESDVVLTGQDLCILADALQHFADDFFDEIIDAYDLAGDIDAEVEDDDLITPGGYSFNELANLGRKIGLAVDTLPG